MNELKACPFCGGEAQLINDDTGCGWEDAVYIVCGGCGVSTRRIWYWWSERHQTAELSKEQAEFAVISAWNARKEVSNG